MIIVAIDDSGDPGFKFARGSSQYFCIAAVYFETKEDAVKMIEVINGLRKKFHLKSGQEFKFHKASMKTRKMFLEEINKNKFGISTVIIDKKMIKENIEAFDLYYNTILKVITKIGSNDKLDIRIDGKSGRKHNEKIKTFFRQNIRKGQLKKLRFVDSKNEDLIQLADMIASVIYFSFTDSNEDLMKIIRGHILAQK